MKEKAPKITERAYNEYPVLFSFIFSFPLTKEIRLKIFDPIISNSFPVRYYGVSGTNLPDIP